MIMNLLSPFFFVLTLFTMQCLKKPFDLMSATTKKRCQRKMLCRYHQFYENESKLMEKRTKTPHRLPPGIGLIKEVTANNYLKYLPTHGTEPSSVLWVCLYDKNEFVLYFWLWNILMNWIPSETSDFFMQCFPSFLVA